MDVSLSAHWQREVPASILALDSFSSHDYADIVTATVSAAPDREPEQWLRAMLDGVPIGLAVAVQAVQRVALGLRLQKRPSPDHLAGWKVADRGESHVRIEAASWLLTGHVIVHVAGERLSFATLVRYDHALAAIVWPPISLIHRQAALALVRSVESAR